MVSVKPMKKPYDLRIFLACCNQTLNQVLIRWKTDKSLCVVLCSKGYPEKYKKGVLIKNLDKILKKQKNELLQLDEKITGFNIGVNIGKDAGQSIMHCHIHLIPRRRGDVEDPRGGVRGVIPSKQKYSRK